MLSIRNARSDTASLYTKGERERNIVYTKVHHSCAKDPRESPWQLIRVAPLVGNKSLHENIDMYMRTPQAAGNTPENGGTSSLARAAP